MKRTHPALGTLTRTLLLLPSLSFAQAPNAAPPSAPATASVPAGPRFEIADVHLSTRKKATAMSGGYLNGDYYIVHHATLVELIGKAYGYPTRKVLGKPFWAMNIRYDIVAKAPADTPDDVISAMLRALLVDRFKLVAHLEDASLPAHLMTAPQGSLKLKPSDGSGTPGCKSQLSADALPAPGTPVQFTCHAESMADFAAFLHEIMSNPNQPEVDATNLKGLWDFSFSALYPPRTSSESATNFKAIEDQLGLKIEAGRSMQPVVMLDSLESPTPNLPNVAALLSPPTLAKFAVATIKRSSPDNKEVLGHIGGGQVVLTGVTLQFLINFAFDLNDQMIANAPKWLDQDKFDIAAAVTPPDTSSDAANTASRFDDEDLPELMKKFLQERFAIKSHMENRPADAYILLAVNPKMKKANPLFHTECKEGPGPDGNDPRIATPVLGRLISCQNITMAQFADEMPLRSTGYIKIPVYDATGLKDAYDFALSFSGYSQVGGINEWSLTTPTKGTPAPGHLVVPPGGLLLFDAIEQQLGLKLEKQKRPTPMLVLDHINENPTGN